MIYSGIAQLLPLHPSSPPTDRRTEAGRTTADYFAAAPRIFKTPHSSLPFCPSSPPLPFARSAVLSAAPALSGADTAAWHFFATVLRDLRGKQAISSVRSLSREHFALCGPTQTPKRTCAPEAGSGGPLPPLLWPHFARWTAKKFPGQWVAE